MLQNVTGFTKCHVHCKVHWYISDFLSIILDEKVKLEKLFLLLFLTHFIYYLIIQLDNEFRRDDSKICGKATG